jgi:restriction endonuclease
MGTPPVAPDSKVSLTDLLQYIDNNSINSKQIFDCLCPTFNNTEYSQKVAQIEAINAAPKPADKTKAQWEGEKNSAKGHLFEELMSIVLSAVEPFSTWNNVQTTTSEIDILVEIGPSGTWIPALREWGTHFLCECKFSHDHVSIQWITNLNTVMQTHNASVGVFFATKGVTGRGNGARAKRLIEDLSIMTPGRFILCVDSTDLNLVAQGQNFLSLISHRYMEVKANTGKLRLLQS